MKKYIFFSPRGKYWFELTHKLLNQNIAQPVLWLCDDSNYKDAKKIFGGNVVKSLNSFVHYPHRMEHTEFSGEYYQFLLSNNYLKAKDRCLKMLDRLDLYGFFSRKDREIYFHNIVLWGLKHLSENKPDFLLTVVAPHSHAQYVFYEICKFLNIPILRFNQWTIAPCIYLRRMDIGKTINYSTLKGEIAEKIKHRIDLICKDIINPKNQENFFQKYIKLQKDRQTLKFQISNIIFGSIPRGKKEIIYDIKYLLIRLSFIFMKNNKNRRIKFFEHFIKSDFYDKDECYNFFYSSHYDPINPFGLKSFSRYKFADKKRLNLKNEISSLPNYIKPKENFVFFPLHYEHEATTNPMGGGFHDQLIALATLRSFIPNDIKIIIKEHPTQYYFSMKGPNSYRGPAGRSPIYKNVVQNIKNSEYIGVKSDTRQILNDCMFVATITGSVAFEAALLGKKAIVFGEAWFSGSPNIFEWNSKLNFNDFISLKTSSSEEVIEFLKQQVVNTCALGTQTDKGREKIDNTEVFKDYNSISFKSIYELLSYAISEI